MGTCRSGQGRGNDTLLLCHNSMVKKVLCLVRCKHRASLTYISENIPAWMLGWIWEIWAIALAVSQNLALHWWLAKSLIIHGCLLLLCTLLWTMMQISGWKETFITAGNVLSDGQSLLDYTDNTGQAQARAAEEKPKDSDLRVQKWFPNQKQ